MLTQRLLCGQRSSRAAAPATTGTQARRAHLLVVTPAGRAHRRRAHALVCGRSTDEALNAASGAGHARHSHRDIAPSTAQRYKTPEVGAAPRRLADAPA